jgi:hypothetical protein
MRLAALLALALVLAAGPARADGVLLTSKQPYWKVGPRDEALSRACSLNQFNLQRPERYLARFAGPEGHETLGVAKGNGLNLYDPKKRAKPTEDYYFRNHGTTQCEVFVGGRKGKKS